MFEGLQQSNLTNGSFICKGDGKMFEKAKGLIISGGNYTAHGDSTGLAGNKPK